MSSYSDLYPILVIPYAQRNFKIWIFGNFFKFVTLTLSSAGVSQNADILVVLVVLYFTGLYEGNRLVIGGFSLHRTSNLKLLCFLCCYPEQSYEQTVQLLFISGTMTFTWCHCNVVRVLIYRDNYWDTQRYELSCWYSYHSDNLFVLDKIKHVIIMRKMLTPFSHPFNC